MTVAVRTSPWVARARWLVMLLQGSWRRSQRHRLPLLAAGVTFFAFLSLFPALVAVVMIYGLLSRPEDATAQVQHYASSLPPESQHVLASTLRSISQSGSSGLTVGVAIAIVGAVWSASGGVNNLITALNISYEVDSDRGMVKNRALAIGLTCASVAFVLVAVGLITIAPALLRASGLSAVAGAGLQVVRWLLLVLLALTGLGVIYRVAPDSRAPRVKWTSAGAVAATCAWLTASALFGIYIAHFGSYNKVYGTLAGVVVLLLWIYLTCFIVLFGAEVNAVVGGSDHRRRGKPRSAREEKER